MDGLTFFCSFSTQTNFSWRFHIYYMLCKIVVWMDTVEQAKKQHRKSLKKGVTHNLVAIPNNTWFRKKKVFQCISALEENSFLYLHMNAYVQCMFMHVNGYPTTTCNLRKANL